MVTFVWKCRDCKNEYPEDEKVPGVHMRTYRNPSGIATRVCRCGGIVDLVAVKPSVQRTQEQLDDFYEYLDEIIDIGTGGE